MAMLYRVLTARGIALAIVPARADDPVETWTPTSNNAESLGRIRFSPTRITLQNGASMQIAASGTVPFKTDIGPTVRATVYKVMQQDDPHRPGKAGLCDTSPAAFVLVWKPARVGADIDPMALNAFKDSHFVVERRAIAGGSRSRRLPGAEVSPSRSRYSSRSKRVPFEQPPRRQFATLCPS